MTRALDELRIDGLITSVSFHKKMMNNEAYRRGELHTGFLEEHGELTAPEDDPWLNEIAVVAASVEHFRRVESRSARAVAGGAGAPRSAWKWSGRAGGWRR